MQSTLFSDSPGVFLGACPMRGSRGRGLPPNIVFGLTSPFCCEFPPWVLFESSKAWFRVGFVFFFFGNSIGVLGVLGSLVAFSSRLMRTGFLLFWTQWNCFVIQWFCNSQQFSKAAAEKS